MRDDLTISPGGDRDDREPSRRALPLGTQVVTLVPVGTPAGRVVPAGAVAVIVALPAPSDRTYRVRFPNGEEGVVAPDEIDVRAHRQRAGIEAAPAPTAYDSLYNGYVLSQFKKLEQDLRARGHIRWKHAMHLIRLLLAGVTTLREGVVPVQVGEHRERLLAIRRGELSWAEIDAWRLRLHHEFDAAFAATRLPEHPDYARADAYLIAVRRDMARR